MAHGTDTKDTAQLTSDEMKVLLKLLKHPKIKQMADEVKEDEK